VERQHDILSEGTLFWCKSNHRGKVAVPLGVLDENQKQALREGLESGRYDRFFDLDISRVHFVWEENTGLFEVLVTDFSLSAETKRRLSGLKRPAEKFPYRFALSDVKRLQADFSSGTVSDSFVRDLLDRQPWRPWTTAEWNSLRDEKIGDACENCGKTEDLVLQHTIQPRKVKKIVAEFMLENHERFQTYIEQHKDDIELPLPKDTKLVPVCPKCGSSQVRYRQRRGNYVCEKTRNYLTCKFEFDTPKYGYDEKDLKAAEKRRRSILKKRFCEEVGIYHEAVRIAIDEIVSYLKMEHSKTLCQGCAFVEDRLHLTICSVCGKNRHNDQYAMCWECAKKRWRQHE
jgi:hypothetical protein